MSRMSMQQSVAGTPGHFVEGTPTTLAYGVIAAAAALDLSRSRIYELISDGEIGACKIGKRTVIPASELTAFLDRHRVTRLPAEIAIAPLQGRLGRARVSR